MRSVRYDPIGIVHTPFPEPAGTPVQPAGAEGAAGLVEVFPQFAKGLEDLDGFSHIFLLYHCHLAGPPELEVTPFLDHEPRGVFATRAPARPNAIGLSVVRLVGIEGSTLRVRDIDVVDGTPLLDIKPFVPAFDARAATRIGWLQGRADRLSHTTDDGRFAG
jgi:tRNA-Thr(GGU) m(6)t(6)A37 methyltransferase TsaA